MDGSSFSPLIELFRRIDSERIKNEQNSRMNHFKYSFILLIFVICFSHLFQYDNQIYNSLFGPFHLNLNQFIEHLQISNKQISSEKSNWFSFKEEYLQVELGEDHIQQLFQHTFLRLINEPIIMTSLYPNRLYVKLPAKEQSHYHSRLAFRFHSFSLKTLKCIEKQMNIFPIDNSKSKSIEIIETIYNQNATRFNEQVLIKCGILVGYLYRPRGEHSLFQIDNLKLLDIAIDASSKYYPFKAFFLLYIICPCLLIKILLDILLYIFYCINLRPTLKINSIIKDQLKQININSVQLLNDLVNESTENGYSYHNQVFIIKNKYLILLNIDVNENQPEILKNYCQIESPLTIVFISSIVGVKTDAFLTTDNKWIYFPIILNEIYDQNVNQWLHNHLMVISETYRNYYEEELNRTDMEQYEYLLAIFIAEEEEYQQLNNRNNIERMWRGVTSASSRFIAQFRLRKHLKIESNLDRECAICFEIFRINEKYSQWPCPAQHIFHYQCMLQLLRTDNKCPLCRFTVEPDPSTLRNFFSRFFT